MRNIFLVSCLCIGYSFSVSANTNVATITKLDGEVQIFSNPGKTIQGPAPHALFEGEYFSVRNAKIGDKIDKGNIVRTAPSGQSKVVYENGDQVHVGPASAYRVQWEGVEEKPKTSFSLLYGKIRNVISKSGPRSGLEVKAGSATMGVRGTDFYVSKRGVTNTAEVTTLRGSVSVKTAKATKAVEVKPGYSAVVAVKEEKKPEKKSEKIVEVKKADVKVADKGEPAAVTPSIELKKTTQQQLEVISEISTIKESEKTEDKAKAEEVKKLETKATETVMKEIKTYDPKMYDQIVKEKMTSSDDINSKTLGKIAKTAPVEVLSGKKPTEDELQDMNGDSYDNYFKKVD